MKRLFLLCTISIVLVACRNRALDEVNRVPATETKEEVRNVWELDRHTHDSLMWGDNKPPDSNYAKHKKNGTP